MVLEAEHYIYISAQDYSGVKGLVDNEILDVPANLVGHVYIG